MTRMDETLTFGVELEQVEGYEFRVRFDWPDVPELTLDLKSKFRLNPGPEKFGDLPHQERCLEQFENFCIVTESIRAGIPVSVNVVDATGKVADAVA